MRKLILIGLLTAAFGLSGCGLIQRQQAHWGGHTKVCVEGHSYIQFPTGTVEQHDDNGKPVLCGAAAKKAAG